MARSSFSSVWDTKFDDPLAPKQRWYCKWCGNRYFLWMGVLIGLVIKGKARYAAADEIPWGLKDVKCMSIEQRFQEIISAGCTPLELKDALPTVAPVDGGELLKPALGENGTPMQGVYRVDLPLFDQLPRFNWDDLYHLRDKARARQGLPPLSRGSASHRAMPHDAALEYAEMEVHEV